MKIKNSEVSSTRKEVHRLLSVVPDKRYCDCSEQEKMAFDNLSEAMKLHRDAVRRARSVQ
jgi:hypothetical protein